MVEALILYLASIVISFVEDKINYYRVLYEINSQGTYVVPQMFKVAFKTTYETSIIEKLIPLYNVLKPIYNNMIIPNTIDKFYDVLNKADVLELMEPEKKQELMENPTIAKAKELSNQHEKEIHKYSIIAFNDHSIIYFDNKDTSISKIKRVLGPLSHEDGLDQFKRLDHAIDLYKTFVNVVYKDQLTEEELNEVLNNQFTFDLTEIDDTISLEEFNNGLEEAIEKIINMKQSQKDAKTLKKMLKK